LLWIKRTNFLRPHIRSDNAPEFTAKAVREWLELVGVKTLFIEPGMRKRVDFLLFYRNVYCKAENLVLRARSESVGFAEIVNKDRMVGIKAQRHRVKTKRLSLIIS
jgi:hypothetical protein